MKPRMFVLVTVLAALAVSAPSAVGQTSNNAIAYQGRLKIAGGTPDPGARFDLRFRLFDAATGGNQLDESFVQTVTPDTNGLFTVMVDAHPTWSSGGTVQWIELGTRRSGATSDYVTLTPRQRVSPVPTALHAQHADVANAFTGPLSIAQLPAGVARLDTAQTFTAPPSFMPASGAPFMVSTTQRVANLNADLLDGLDSSAFLLKAEHCLATIAELKAQDAGFVPCVLVLGYHMRGDGGGGVFYWDAELSLADDLGTIIAPNSNPAQGRWRRIHDGSLSVRWFGATGTEDDSTALRAAFNAVPASGAIVRVPPGTYMVNRFLALKSNTHLTGVGAASVFKRTDGGGDTIFFSETVSNVTVETIAIDLNGAGIGAPRGSFANGLAFRTQCSEIRIRDVRILDSTGSNVCCRHGILVLESDHVWIERNHLTDGMRIKAGGIGDKLIIAENMLEEPNDNAITIAIQVPDTETINYIIRNNVVKAATGVSIYIGDDGRAPDQPPRVGEIIYSDIVVDGNLLTGPAPWGAPMVVVKLASATRRLHLVNNILSTFGPPNPYTSGIQITMQDTDINRPGCDFLIANNTIDGPFELAGIWVVAVRGVRIANNQISNGSRSQYAIWLGAPIGSAGAVDTASVQGNLARGCHIGLVVEDSSNVIVNGNSFTDMDLVGINLTTVHANSRVSVLVMGNHVSGNGTGISEYGPGAFDSQYLFNDLRNNTGGPFDNINSAATRLGNLGTDEYIQRHSSGTALWDPSALLTGTATSMNVSVSGATVGDTVAVGFSQPVPAGALLTGSVTAANTVTVTLLNVTGGALDLEPGILRADMWKH